jgi:ribose transport system permease protein
MQKVEITNNNISEKIQKFLNSLPPLTWVVVALIIIFGLISPEFFHVANLTNVLRRGSTLWVLATMATLLLISGGLDLSLGSVLTFSGVVLAIFLRAGYSAGIASLAAILSGTIVGIINGLLVSFLGIPAFIVTLGTMNVFAGLSVAISETSAIFIDNPTMVFIGAGAIAGIPIPVIVSILIFVISYIIFHHTSFGRYLVAIGENRMGAHLSGVNTQRYTWLIFAYASTMAAIAGVVLASRIQSADPRVGAGWEFDAVAASIMGGTLRGVGKGDITTTIIGVLLIIVLRNGLNIISVPVEWRTAVIGLFMLAGIIFDITVRRREN